jgi:hypothetical protein
VSGNTISANTAGSGGGLYLDSSAAKLSGNTITSNSAHFGRGGGLYLSQYSDAARLSANTITSNSAHFGGGLYLNSDARLSANTIASNTASYGGGLYLYRSNATLVNNMLTDNRADWLGSGLYILSASPCLLHTTIARNGGGDGSGVYVAKRASIHSTVALTNTILVSQTVGITVTAGNTTTLETTLWGSEAWANTTDWGGAGSTIVGARNYRGAPAFVAPNAGDYHIGPGSAAIDRGLDVRVATDIDSEIRPDGCFVDIGADEFITGVECRRVYLSLILRDD